MQTVQWLVQNGQALGPVGLLLLFIGLSSVALNREWVILGPRFREAKVALAEAKDALKAANAALDETRGEREEIKVQLARLETERSLVWQEFAAETKRRGTRRPQREAP